MVTVKVKRLSSTARLPQRAYEDDLCADVYSDREVTIGPRCIVLVPIGIALETPKGYGAIVEDRSSLALAGLVTLGGVIDPGYRGEIKVIIASLCDQTVNLPAGTRVAQLRLVTQLPATFVEAEELDGSPRGTAGYGSSGRT